MKAYLATGLTVIAAYCATANAQSAAELSPVLKEKIAAYQACLKATDDQLRLGRVTPERYEMAMEGSCLQQYEAATREMKAHLEAIPHPRVSNDDAQEITANTMASIRSSDVRLRKQYVTTYLLWYASSDRPQGKGSR